VVAMPAGVVDAGGSTEAGLDAVTVGEPEAVSEAMAAFCDDEHAVASKMVAARAAETTKICFIQQIYPSNHVYNGH
jgi:hypothetical protein